MLLNFFYVYSQTTRVIYKKARYNTETEADKLKNASNPVANSEMYLKLKKSFELEFNREFELLYNNTESQFKKIEVMKNDNDKELLNFEIDNEIYYKNIETKEKFYFDNSSFDGKYIVELPYDQYKWNITNESKTINGYLCYKATTTYEDIYNPITKRKLTIMKEVWFTPSIPSSFGPIGLDGLPGLVLEASINNKMYFYASKIEFDVKDAKIEKITEGKKITLKDVENMLIKIHNDRN
ncbi:GLPGLI family protein [Flavobacterium croceum DSM 17960]|uniref:GLPGLI family protein n=2 Tax=Flavobacterium TaxID=237 RepID=A0A2S4N6Q3_9FLAO|nr:GLPGLI family protein [Flavobacterium croceum DSM 17960]